MYVLDTNVISELRKTRQGNAEQAVVAWAAARPLSTFFLSVITIMEVELGILLADRRDPPYSAVLRRWLDHSVLPAFSGRILMVDVAVAKRCAQLHVPNRQADRDAFIAATALVHGMTVVTRNVADFDRPGLRVINPWVG